MIIAGTGHRPMNLPCRYSENHPWAKRVKSDLKDWLIQIKPDVIISGMALGWDTWVAEAAVDLGVKLWCYIPFRGQGTKWSEGMLIRYQKLLEKADFVDVTSDRYHKDVFLERDRRMVDVADRIVALHNPDITKGGTWYTIQYAMSRNKEIKNLWHS